MPHCVDRGLCGFGGVSLGGARRKLPRHYVVAKVRVPYIKPQILRFALGIKITAFFGATLNVVSCIEDKSDQSLVFPTINSLSEYRTESGYSTV